MSSRHLAELLKLRATIRLMPGRCTTCRYWFGSPIVAVGHDGTATWRSEEPTCPDCGRAIELVREHRVIGVTADALKRMFTPAGGRS